MISICRKHLHEIPCSGLFFCTVRRSTGISTCIGNIRLCLRRMMLLMRLFPRLYGFIRVGRQRFSVVFFLLLDFLVVGDVAWIGHE